MSFYSEENSFSGKSLFMGTCFSILMLFMLAILLGLLAGFDRFGMLLENSVVYPIVVYGSVIVGAFWSGLHSSANGWLAGASIGFAVSLFLLLLAVLFGEQILISRFLFKLPINMMIGILGGIVGVNIADK